MSKYDPRRYDEILVKQQYGDPFVASYGEEEDIAPLGLSRAQKKAAAKAKAKEEKEMAKAAKAEAKAAAKAAKAEEKTEAKEKSISINANSPKSMKNRRGRVHATNNVINTIAQRIRQNPRMTRTHATNNVTKKTGFRNVLNLRKKESQNVPKERKNMTFIERKIADMLRRETQEEKNAIARKELDEMVKKQNFEKEEENAALEKHLQSIHASETRDGLNKGLAKSIKRMSIKEDPKNSPNTLPFFQGLIEPAKTNPRPRPQPRVRAKTENGPKPNAPKPRPRPVPKPRVRQKTENGPKPTPVPRGRAVPRAVPRGTRKNV